ncbi:MAG: GtrA family protein [Propionibacteriaceae bacterium]|jgi:putative flippase GtrA|nr:GtrA family protein [Propionibacteriaceae bacterium]
MSGLGSKLWALARHPEIVQLVRYGLVAAVALAVDTAVLWVGHRLGVHYLVAAALGFCVGLVVNFLLAERFAFGAAKVSSAWLRFGTYAVVGLGGLGLLELMMYLLHGRAGLHLLVSKAIATVVGFCWNYVGRRVLYRSRGAAGKVN